LGDIRETIVVVTRCLSAMESLDIQATNLYMLLLLVAAAVAK